MKKVIILFLIGLAVICSLYAKRYDKVVENEIHNNIISRDTTLQDYVPDEETAKKIAEAIWLPIYGERILDQRPYKAKLIDDIWVVEGLIPYPYRDEPEYRGGTAYIEIQKKDCKILKVTHYK